MQKYRLNEAADSTLSIGQKVAFLKLAGSYLHPVTNVETRETHMSWVFLANGFVYKLKKPVKNNFVDFRYLESRYLNCKEELRLNKRLAPDVYLGLVPLICDKSGQLSFNGKGEIVDWLVKMKRLPEENMLDNAIRNNTVSQTLLKKAASLLSEFYKISPSIIIEPQVYVERQKGEISGIYRELIKPVYHLPGTQIELLITGLLKYLSNNPNVFYQRINEGRVIEAHGDLRPEHICLAHAPAIIDCLEFNRDLRILDVAEELSFLAMECEMLGDPSAGKIFLESYISLASDQVPDSLIIFYKIKKACLRCYLVIRHILEVAYKDEIKWTTKANQYLELAKVYLSQLPG
ncbi:hypothetical protein [Flavihumibacter profundi]|uniref:hypothetical protein n=1 Tax=Flavihumibacter profundi TaxID=2716883 RepID=UPI001CC6D915|nr:hypothetical protein [Flavihumibacter profundi]MBZ5856325.1 hypothetical protein [Flavihumibacter profundi]